MKMPSIGLLRFITGVRRQGFLAFVGEQWRAHGDLFQVKIGSRTLVFAMHPDVVERVNVTHRQNYEKLASYDGVRQFLLGEGLVVSTGELWKRQRKLMAPFYTPKGVQAYAELMIKDGVRLVDRWQGLAGQEVEIAEEMTLITASIILKAMFSTETIESINTMRESVETMLAFVNGRMTGLALPTWLPTAKNRKFFAARERVNRAIGLLLAQRKATDEALWPDDLLSRLMRARDDETGTAMSDALLRDESITTFFAGHETTARTMTFTWLALASNPHVAQKLHAELDGVLGGQPPTVEALKQLPYTLQVVKEVLRLYPAAPFYVRDAVGPDEIGGMPIPAGAAVMLSPYYTHRHPKFWNQPEAFDPDRWTREAEGARHGHCYHPFAAGPRVCIGNNFSLLESHLLLATLAQRFAPRLRDGYAPKWEMQGTLHLGNGLPMTLTPRESRHP